jgi:hypothetical protein
MMSDQDAIRLLQFRAAYNLPVHAGIETGMFARHGLRIDVASRRWAEKSPRQLIRHIRA